jgi:outer membrane protein TolC
MTIKHIFLKSTFLVGIISLANLAPVRAQTLEATVADVLRTHPRLSAARANALGVESEIEIANAALRPKLGFSGGAGRGRNFATNNVNPAGDIAMQGTYPLYDGNRAVNEIARQESRFVNAAQRANQVRDTLISQTSDAYIEVIKQESLEKIALSNVEAHESLMAKVTEIVQLDRGRAIDATQVAVRLQQAKVNLNARRNALNEAITALEDLTGQRQGGEKKVRDPKAAMPTSLPEATSLLEDHPTTKAARADAKAADRAAQIAAAWDKPRIDLLGTLSNPSSFTNTRYFSNADVRLGVQWSAFDGGAGKAAALASNQQRIAANEQVKSVMRDLSSDVSRSWAQMKSREGRFIAFSDLAMRAREVREAYWEQFRIGRRSILDLLNAENEGFLATLQAEQERQELLQNQYRVLASTGRLALWLGLDEPVIVPNAESNLLKINQSTGRSLLPDLK